MSISPIPRDTSPEVAQLQAEILRAMSPGRRLEIALEMSDLTRELCSARLRRDNPTWSQTDVARELLRIALAPAPLPAELE
jgi:hypothetical protein